eukprot:TRINITY_DN8718_c0_g1_i1.p1 TRINITY_DN8718_c0_g1~~TRINITY_DN8718_c0_g1_i1.p1  ORF type:complete len:403 (+),score=37.55 TRINITY_DN8718_c0_g1_i1:304-1512(+)
MDGPGGLPDLNGRAPDISVYQHTILTKTCDLVGDVKFAKRFAKKPTKRPKTAVESALSVYQQPVAHFIGEDVTQITAYITRLLVDSPLRSQQIGFLTDGVHIEFFQVKKAHGSSIELFRTNCIPVVGLGGEYLLYLLKHPQSVSLPPVLHIAQSRYTPIEMIGSGSTGDVYTVYDESSNKYAWKKAKRRQNLRVEIGTYQMIAKEPAVHDFFLKMIASTQDHKSIILQYATQPMSHGIETLAPVISALKFLHDNDICHRDPRANNILYIGSRPVLVDFSCCCLRGTFVPYAGTQRFASDKVIEERLRSPFVRSLPQDDLWTVTKMFVCEICGKESEIAAIPQDDWKATQEFWSEFWTQHPIAYRKFTYLINALRYFDLVTVIQFMSLNGLEARLPYPRPSAF